MDSIAYAALHGVDIPGGVWWDEAKIRAALQRLPASMAFLRIVGRPDNILIAVPGAMTEDKCDVP